MNNDFQNGAVFDSPEVLTFSNWTLFMEISIFFVNFAPGSIAQVN